ncbi:hypothetical protein LBBP_03309 [Leptospira borgpetersenii serovar Ballum]|uniref:Uncharacterized protein n=1 Tax=Leptospira borgpetersenii serovar Ballum TaxID=280505 RepID=A0A0S2IV35_LEPBO|nr:hypothetical protein LBBP_03309 [Leptospira borgpetersenii serovar Ballum]
MSFTGYFFLRVFFRSSQRSSLYSRYDPRKNFLNRESTLYFTEGIIF